MDDRVGYGGLRYAWMACALAASWGTLDADSRGRGPRRDPLPSQALPM